MVQLQPLDCQLRSWHHEDEEQACTHQVILWVHISLQLREPRLEVLGVGRAIVISSECYYSWDGSLLQPTQNALYWEQ